MIAGLSVNIFNREPHTFRPWPSHYKLLVLEAAIKQVESDLRTTSGKISLSLSIFIVVLGSMPLLWTAISEIKGRKVRLYLIGPLFRLLRSFPRILSLQGGLRCLFRDCYGGIYNHCRG